MGSLHGKNKKVMDKTIVYASVTIVGEIVVCKLAYTYIQNFKNQYDKLLFY